jgi:hypothetical protein
VWRVLFTSDGKIWFAQQGGVTSWLPAPEAEPGEMSETGTPPAGATAQPTASAEPVEDVWESLRAFPYLGNREATVATDGRLWLAHAVYEPASGLWERTAYDEIQLYDLAPDAHGGLWIARRDGALYLPDGVSSPRDEWLLFGTPEGLPSDQVTVVALEGEDLLWIGTEDGLVRCEVPPIAQATP